MVGKEDTRQLGKTVDVLSLFYSSKVPSCSACLLIDSEFIPKTKHCHPSEMTELTISDGRYGLVSFEAMHARSDGNLSRLTWICGGFVSHSTIPMCPGFLVQPSRKDPCRIPSHYCSVILPPNDLTKTYELPCF